MGIIGPDPNPDVALEAIFPLSSRAYSLFSRRQGNKIPEENFWKYYGVVPMMEGLEYHYQNYIRLHDPQIFTPNWFQSSDLITIMKRLDIKSSIDHEVVAYINRLGQIFFWIKSDFINKILPNAVESATRTVQLQIFRNKHTAHRSMDDPRGESEETKISQAMSLGGSMHSFAQDGKSVYTIYSDNGEATFLHLPTDHNKVLNEAYSIVENLLSNTNIL